jgi:hypothetical protein
VTGSLIALLRSGAFDLYESAPGRDVRGIADDLGIEDGPLRGWLETLGTGKKAAADGTLTRSPGPLQHDKRRRRRLGGNLPDRDLPAQRLRVARPDRLRLGVDDHPLVPTGTRSRPAARRRRLRDKRQASQGSGVQGAERRLASLRAGILSALPACGPAAPDQGHLHTSDSPAVSPTTEPRKPATAGRERKDPAERRSEIVDAAIDILGRQGYRQGSLREPRLRWVSPFPDSCTIFRPKRRCSPPPSTSAPDAALRHEAAEANAHHPLT